MLPARCRYLLFYCLLVSVAPNKNSSRVLWALLAWSSLKIARARTRKTKLLCQHLTFIFLFLSSSLLNEAWIVNQVPSQTCPESRESCQTLFYSNLHQGVYRRKNGHVIALPQGWCMVMNMNVNILDRVLQLESTTLHVIILELLPSSSHCNCYIRLSSFVFRHNFLSIPPVNHISSTSLTFE